MEKDVIIDFNELSKLGLIAEINNKILHPLGLALSYDEETGVSTGALVADDYIFEFGEETIKENQEKLKNFIEHRIQILDAYLTANK